MKYLHYKTYLSMIEKSNDLKIFRNFFIQKDDGTIIDILKDGDDSCACFVSNILFMNGLITSAHATVDSTEKDILQSGWVETEKDISKLQKGDLIIWERTKNHKNRHFGIYLGNKLVVHNNYKKRKTDISKIDFRPIEKCFTYTKKEE